MKRLITVLAVVAIVAGCGLKPQEAKKSKSVQQEKVDYMAQAMGNIGQGNIVEAIQRLDQAIRQDPQDLQPYMILGELYMRSNNYDSAVDTFRAALRIEPDNGGIYYLLAMANALRGRRGLALQNAEKALLIFQKERDEEKFKRTLVFLQGISQE